MWMTLVCSTFNIQLQGIRIRNYCLCMYTIINDLQFLGSLLINLSDIAIFWARPSGFPYFVDACGKAVMTLSQKGTKYWTPFLFAFFLLCFDDIYWPFLLNFTSNAHLAQTWYLNWWLIVINDHPSTYDWLGKRIEVEAEAPKSCDFSLRS